MSTKLSLKGSAISGRGVFAEEPVRRGETLYRLGGERVSLLQCISGIVRGRIRMDDPLAIGKYEYIVLDDFSIRFNHSCEANTGLVGESDLVALVDIPRGQEITFDYSMTVRPSILTLFWSMPCKCGAPSCRGRIGDIRSISPQRLRTYRQAGALQDYILDLCKGPQDAHAPGLPA